MFRNFLSASLVTLLASVCLPSSACTNLIVGKKASADGSVICTYNCDGYGFSGWMAYRPAGRHAKGEQLAVHEWENPNVKGYIDEAEYTYQVMGWMNENQVTIAETTFDGRLDLVNREGLFDYATLMVVGLQRSRTAREAIEVMTDLVDKHGYCSSGETFTVCDKNEAWILEMIGKGPDRKGAVWVALRVPDDCICAHANLSRIRQFPFKDKENCMYSKDVISFAREKGYFTGKDSEFSFRDAYCPIDFENVRYADARVWSFFRHHTDKDEMDKYLPYLNGDHATCDHLPLWIKPDAPLSVTDVMHDMRDHFEGTALDMTADMSAGPWGMPIRPRPITWKSDGNDYFGERPIATQQSGYTMVAQMRSWLPDAVGGIYYYGMDDSNMISYVPVFCGSNEVPEAFRAENNNYADLNFKGAFWMSNFVSNMIYPRYSLIIGDLRDAQDELEAYYQHAIDSVTNQVKDMAPLDRSKVLNRFGADNARRMMARWEKLARLIIVKYNDFIVLPSKDGVVDPNYWGRMGKASYRQEYLDQVAKDTGERYKLKKLIERRER